MCFLWLQLVGLDRRTIPRKRGFWLGVVVAANSTRNWKIIGRSSSFIALAEKGRATYQSNTNAATLISIIFPDFYRHFTPSCL